MKNMKNNNITNMLAIAGAIIVVGSVVGGEAQLPIWGDLK